MGDELRFDGRVALITGGGRGLGRAYALALAARGCRVVVNDIGVGTAGQVLDEDPAADVVAEITAAGGEAAPERSSVATADGGRAMVAAALDAFGRLDVVVHNAGIASVVHELDELNDAELDGVLHTHLHGAFHVLRPAWAHLRAQGGGRIVLASSATALGVENAPHYSAAKAGLLGLAKSLAVAGARHGIVANAIMPMAYTRAMHGYEKEEIRAWMEATFRPEQVAPVVVFLAHESVPCTGEVLSVGGGRVGRVFFGAVPGLRDPDLTPEAVAAGFETVMDPTAHVLVRDSRDESALFGGQDAHGIGRYDRGGR